MTRHTSIALCCLLLTLAGCAPPDPNRVQGYVEGEFVYMASPAASTLQALYVQRGAEVKAGAELYALDATPQRAARDEAARKLAQGRASLADLQKGKRPTEIAALEAQLQQARAALTFSELDLERQQQLQRGTASARQDYERAQAMRNQDQQRVYQLQADVQTARLGARSDQIDAAEANVRALEAALARADWDLAQQSQRAPQAGVVFDTLYREGEWVPAGKPVIVLLPPANIKVRAFVPQTRLGQVKLGQTVYVTVDGAAAPYVGKVSFISPRAEYSPPVIYSRESRARLVFLIEVVFDPQTAVKLHPGQPVDVQLQGDNLTQ